MASEKTVTGTVKVFFTRERPDRNGKYGYGWIRRTDGPDVWFHSREAESLIRELGEDNLKGAKVVFEIVQSPKGLQAVDVVLEVSDLPVEYSDWRVEGTRVAAIGRRGPRLEGKYYFTPDEAEVAGCPVEVSEVIRAKLAEEERQRLARRRPLGHTRVFAVHERGRRELDDGGSVTDYSDYFKAVRLDGWFGPDEVSWTDRHQVGEEKWEEIGRIRAGGLIAAAQEILGLPDPAPSWQDNNEDGWQALPRGVRWREYWVRAEQVRPGGDFELAFYTEEAWEEVQAKLRAEAETTQEAADRRFQEGLRRQGERDRQRIEDQRAAAEAARKQRLVYGGGRPSKRRVPCPYCGADSPPGEHTCDIEEL